MIHYVKRNDFNRASRVYRWQRHRYSCLRRIEGDMSEGNVGNEVDQGVKLGFWAKVYSLTGIPWRMCSWRMRSMISGVQEWYQVPSG